MGAMPLAASKVAEEVHANRVSQDSVDQSALHNLVFRPDGRHTNKCFAILVTVPGEADRITANTILDCDTTNNFPFLGYAAIANVLSFVRCGGITIFGESDVARTDSSLLIQAA